MKQQFISVMMILAVLVVSILPVAAEPNFTFSLALILGKGLALSSAWSPDGKTIAVGSSGSLWLYTDTLEETKQLAAEPATQLLWNPQSDILASENEHGVTLWDTRRAVRMIQLDGYSFPATWSPDGDTLALIAPNKHIVLWGIAGQQERLEITDYQQNDVASVQFLAWNTDQLIGIASNHDPSFSASRCTFFVWNSKTGELLSTAHPKTDIDPRYIPLAKLINLKPSSAEILWIAQDHFLRFDVQNGQTLASSQSGEIDLHDLAVSPDGKRFATIDWALRQISIWDAETLTLLNILSDGPDEAESASHVTWSPDGKRLLTDAPGAIKIWDVEANSVLHQRTDYMTRVNDLAWSPDGTLLATANGEDTSGVWDFRVRLWNVQKHRIQRVCEGATGQVWSVDWSPEGTRLVTTGGGFHFSDNKVRVWNAATCTLENSAETGTIWTSDSAWSPNGKYIAAQVGGAIEIWEAGELSKAPRMLPIGLTEDVVWHPVYPWLVVELGGNLEIYDTSGAKIHILGEPYPQVEPVRSFPSHLGLVRASAWDHSGTYLAVGGGDFMANNPQNTPNYAIEIWDITTSTLKQTLVGHEDGITSLSWDPSGRYLASASADKTVRVWDTTTGKQIAVLEGHTDIVSTVAWSSDGTLLASGSYDGTVHIWSVEN